MKKLVAAILLFTPAIAGASCVGSGSLQTCFDDSGNSYTVNRLGNQTIVSGYNSRTGNSWSQNSTHIGNSTYTNGIDADGNSWNSTSTRVGNTVIQSGTDSDGNSFSNSYYDSYDDYDDN